MTEATPDVGLDQRIEIIREFNRMYADRIGLLAENIFGSTFTAAEIRVLNELSTKNATTASVLCKSLVIDGGYLSRILSAFERKGYITKERSKEDARQRLILLTKKGRKEVEAIIREAQRIMRGIISPLPVEEQIRLVASMSTIDRIINGTATPYPRRVQDNYTLRRHRLGDIGLVIHHNAAQCAADYGWNAEFEQLLCEEAAKFIHDFDETREGGWVVEIDARMVGAVFLRKHAQDTGMICLLYVSPMARGMGLGALLLKEAIAFGRAAGYKKLQMETQSAASFVQALFKKTGLTLVSETQNRRRFGQEQTGQLWEIDLSVP